MPDIGINESNRFANDLRTVEEFYKKELHVDSLAEANGIQRHTQISSTQPQPPATEVLMQDRTRASWASFETPPGSTNRILSSYISSPTQLVADKERLLATMQERNTQAVGQEEFEGQELLNLMQEATDYNALVEAVKGQLNAFLGA